VAVQNSQDFDLLCGNSVEDYMRRIGERPQAGTDFASFAS
jgi:hypothetical protein